MAPVKLWCALLLSRVAADGTASITYDGATINLNKDATVNGTMSHQTAYFYAGTLGDNGTPDSAPSTNAWSAVLDTFSTVEARNDFDGGGFDSSANVFTAPVDGIYHVHYTLTVNYASPINSWTKAAIFKNGASGYGESANYQSNYYPSLSGAGTFAMVAGDTVSLYIYLTEDITSYYSYACSFGGHLVMATT